MMEPYLSLLAVAVAAINAIRVIYHTLTCFSELVGTYIRRLYHIYDDIQKRYTYLRLNHSIKAVLASKKELSQSHIEPIATRKWKEVLAWIIFHPDDLYLVDKRKQTVLHHCCLYRAPAVVIEMILFQAPELVSKKNRDGEIPLHWAIRLSAPTEVLQLLLSVDPGSGCTTKDKSGNTALSLIWERYTNSLLDLWWEQGKDKICEYLWWKRILFLLESYHESTTTRCVGCSDASSDGFLPFLPLHTATNCQHCPVSLYPLIIKVYQDQLRLKDGHGRLPLSVACMDFISNRSSGVKTKIQLLIQEYPSAAHERDNDQRLPLFSALESGIVIDEGISELLVENPGGLQLEDPVTGLAAFQLAAVGSKKRIQHILQNRGGCFSYSYDTSSDELRSLSTIYTILRQEPNKLQQQQLLVK